MNKITFHRLVGVRKSITRLFNFVSKLTVDKVCSSALISIPSNSSSMITSSANHNDNEHENETTNRLKQFDKLQDLIRKKPLK